MSAAGLVAEWLRAGRLDLPLPGHGATSARWLRLGELTETDVVAGRLAEAHADAVAILHELDGPAPASGLWGVWAAESPDGVVSVRRAGDGVVLDGVKQWCSGAGICTGALVTARIDGDVRGLYAVDLTDPTVEVLPGTWRNAGMADSATGPVRFAGTPAHPVGKPGDYLSRPGFWFGAIGVAACWLGGARAVAAPLYARAASGRADDHALAHLGAVDAALSAADALLERSGREIDDDPADRAGAAELRARRVRAVVESAVGEAITRTGRALGPGPLATDERHARAVADLTMYVRQSHAERDLAALGALLGPT